MDQSRHREEHVRCVRSGNAQSEVLISNFEITWKTLFPHMFLAAFRHTRGLIDDVHVLALNERERKENLCFASRWKWIAWKVKVTKTHGSWCRTAPRHCDFAKIVTLSIFVRHVSDIESDGTRCRLSNCQIFDPNVLNRNSSVVKQSQDYAQCVSMLVLKWGLNEATSRSSRIICVYFSCFNLRDRFIFIARGSWLFEALNLRTWIDKLTNIPLRVCF